MKIYKISSNAIDIGDLYEDVKEALEYLEEDYISKSKNSLKKALRKIEEIRPILKNPTKWIDKFEKYR